MPAAGPPADRTVSREIAVHTLRGEVGALLARAGVDDADVEARDLIAAVVGEARFWPSLHRDAMLRAEQALAARRAARARAAGAPFAYAVGRAAFRHLTLMVDDRVLIPRQETELLIDAVNGWVAEDPRRSGGIAIDVGTGSGALALALANEGRFERVIATDISSGAVAVARTNVARLASVLRAPVEVRAGALLAPVHGLQARVIVSNPPYISYSEAPALPRQVRDWEPPIALFAGNGGLAVTSALILGAAEVLEPGGLLAIEVDSQRALATADLLRADGRYDEVRIRPDLTGRDRILMTTRKDG
jgi:release factor glutamine methyltransferase